MTSPTLATIAERGPEAVVPLGQYNQMLGGGGGGHTTINFNGPVISPSRVMDATNQVIKEHNRNPSQYYDDYDDSGIPIEGY